MTPSAVRCAPADESHDGCARATLREAPLGAGFDARSLRVRGFELGLNDGVARR